ncbi:MAG TPA: PhzF family phenazine biosynthesis protein, partial [Candidatus Binatia bacterium]|nr:PhzF family phenazine biosynthesis protein [Candidatus Binatia bacterium]
APAARARFQTRSGLLTAEREGSWIVLDFPALPPAEAELPEGLQAALGAAPRWVGRSRFDYLIEAGSADLVRGLSPDFGALRGVKARGVIVTAPSDTHEFDFVSRFFAPGSGIDEDPVTGSAHCVLGPFWGERLGKRDMVAYQASARGGVVRVGLAGERVRLGGQAVTVMRGDFLG